MKELKPWYAEDVTLPVSTEIDTNLILGSALFGVGWGLAGVCPAPAMGVLSVPVVGCTWIPGCYGKFVIL